MCQSVCINTNEIKKVNLLLSVCLLSWFCSILKVFMCKHLLLSTYLATSIPKPSLKIRTSGSIFWIYLDMFREYDLENISLGIKLFCFSRQKAKTFSICLKNKFNSFTQPIEKNENNNYMNKLNDLKFCEVSRNLISNRC